MDIGIVGAGAAGAAAAYRCRDHDVTVFEKSGGVCGRAASRRRDGSRYVYDYGANYLKSDDERVTELVTEELDTEGLVDVTEPIYTFDAAGDITEGRDADDHKWSYESGITQLAKRLFDRAGTTVHRRTRVDSLDRLDHGWRIRDSDGEPLGEFDAVLLTPPAPQTAEILRASDWGVEARTELADACDAVPYRTIYAALLGYEFERDEPWYALVNTDRKHDCGWLAREELKRGHVPDGESLLVAQMAPDWSLERYNEDPETVVAEAADCIADLLDDDRLRNPAWTDHQGWRFALADDAVAEEPVAAAEEHDLYCAGDWVAGEARVHRALRSGLDVGDRLA